MKIAVLGATGQTGQQLVNQALLQGHVITAIVRNPSKLTINHENLKEDDNFLATLLSILPPHASKTSSALYHKNDANGVNQKNLNFNGSESRKLETYMETIVVEGNIFSEDSLKLHFTGQDAVMSCLGFPLSFIYGVTGYTQSMTATLNAMREVKVNRIITMTSWYTDPNSGTRSTFFIRFILLPMIQSVLSNMYEMEKLLEKTEDINWTVVRPPGLQNTPVTDKEFLTHEGYYVPDENNYPVGQSVSRSDVARFMLFLLGNNTWIKKAVAIITK